MGRGKYSSEQILAILKEQEAGTPVADLCRTYGMHSEAFYAWKHRYARMQSGGAIERRGPLGCPDNEIQPHLERTWESHSWRRAVFNQCRDPGLKVDPAEAVLEAAMSAGAVRSTLSSTPSKSHRRSGLKRGKKPPQTSTFWNPAPGL